MTATDTRVAEAIAAGEQGAERWLPVVGWEDRYEVSDQGRVRNLATPPRIMRDRDNGTGYLSVTLFRPGGKRPQYVHRLVALAFLGPAPSDAHEVCHGDGVRSNNVLANLRWDTHSANMLDAVAAGTHSKARLTHCRRRHLLSAPNLMPYRRDRACRACEVARKRVPREDMTFDEMADACYREITGQVAS